mgnify:CR=1 FL=1
MRLKVWATALALCVAFAAGYRYSAALYDADITALREDYANRSKALEDKYRAKERESMEKLSQAWALRDAALGHVDDLSDELERVRLEADAARRRLSAAGAGTCQSDREQLARCAGLLERSGVLLERGAGLSQRIAIDKDAVARIAGQ